MAGSGLNGKDEDDFLSYNESQEAMNGVKNDCVHKKGLFMWIRKFGFFSILVKHSKQTWKHGFILY